MEDNGDLSVVQLDGVVVLKIIKHCKDNLNEVVTGSIMGLDFDSTLEVTNCFPLPKLADEEEENAENNEGEEYQWEMMKCLREVNVDNNAVGWYTSTHMSDFLNSGTVDTQFTYQDKIKKSVALVYDPFKTSQGSLSLRAFRLTPQFMTLYKDGTFTKDSLILSNFSFKEIWEEIPIRLHNSALITAFLTELEEVGTAETDFEKLDLSTNSYLEKTLEELSKSLEALGQEQTKFQMYQRNMQRQQAQKSAWLQKRRQENAQRKQNGEEPLPEDDPNSGFKPIQEPSRLESLLSTDQISSYCKDINRFSANSFAKLFLSTHLNNAQ